MSKKNCAIVLATTGNMAFALANVISGIMKHSPHLADDIIVYEKYLSANDKKVIKKICPVKFIKYDFELISEQNQSNIDVFSSVAFARYECFDLLDKYKNVIWLDIDILIKNDISEILDYAKKTGISIFGGYDPSAANNFSQIVDGYNMYDACACNSGVFVINDSLPNYNEMKKWCYKTTEELKNYLLTADQGIIGLMIAHFNLEIVVLPFFYNCYPIYDGFEDAIILHPYGPEKFWNFYDEEDWNENYDKWIELGGTPTEIIKFTLLEKLLHQKTINKIEDHEIRLNKEFTNYMIYKYGKRPVYDAYIRLIKMVLLDKITLNDSEFERIIKNMGF